MELRESRKRQHVIRRLYGRGADFNCFGYSPAGTYMLATIPRSGSTFCAIKLWQTGLLGAPMEYLNFRIMGDMFRRLGYAVNEEGRLSADVVARYWRDVQRLRTSSNGVFGFKMFTTNYVEIANRYPNFLQQVTPNYVIYLVRKDLIGQAMSYSRAQRSRVWFSGIENTPDVNYDYQHIKSCLQAIERQRKCWESVFALTKISPIRVFYEDLIASSQLTIGSILQEMGIREDKSCEINVPMIKRQTDGICKEWRERFLEDDARAVA